MTPNELRDHVYEFLHSEGYYLNRVDKVIVGVDKITVHQHVVTDEGCFLHAKNLDYYCRKNEPMFNARGERCEYRDFQHYWDRLSEAAGVFTKHDYE